VTPMSSPDRKKLPAPADVPRDGKFLNPRALLEDKKINPLLHSFLETSELCVCARVAKWWRKYLAGAEQDLRLWRTANFSRTVAHCVTDVTLTGFFKAHPSIEHLNLKFCSKITDTTLIAAAMFLPNLRSLALEGCGRAITNKGVQALSRCAKLEDLDLNGCFRVTPEALLHVASNCPDLVTLSVSGIPAVDDATLQAILRVRDKRKKFTRLYFNSCSKITDAGIKALSALGETFLELELAYCPAISDDGIVTLVSCCPNLTVLNLYGCFKLTDASLAVMGSLSNLKDLNLSMCREITDKGVVKFVEGKGGCRMLESFNLYDCIKITDVSLIALSRSPRLRFLGAFGLDSLTYETLVAFLDAVKTLERIDVGGCQRIRDRVGILATKYPRIAF